MIGLALVAVGCRDPDPDPPHTTAPTATAQTAETGLPTVPWTELTADCTSPEETPSPPECRFATDDWLVLCDYDGQDGVESSWTGRFTAFDRQSATHFEPTDGSEPPALIVFGSPGAWWRAPNLVDEGEVTVHTLGGCGEGFAGRWMAVITDAAGSALLVAGQTDRGAVAGWSVERGQGEPSCPMYVAPRGGCQACRSNVPLHVTGPGFDAEAWQSQTVISGSMNLLVGSAFVGSGLLCEAQSVDLYNWIVTPHAG